MDNTNNTNNRNNDRYQNNTLAEKRYVVRKAVENVISAKDNPVFRSKIERFQRKWEEDANLKSNLEKMMEEEQKKLKRAQEKDIRKGIIPRPFGVYRFKQPVLKPDTEPEKKLDPTQKNNKRYLKKNIKWVFMDITPSISDEKRQIVVTAADGTFQDADATLRAKALAKYKVRKS